MRLLQLCPRPMAGALLVIGLFSIVGCGSGKIAVYPVTGQLLVKGKPAEGAFLVFHPKEGATPESKRPFGTTDKEGKFSVTTFDSGDGAPAGTYKVTVVWRPVPKSTIEAEGADKLGGRYATPTAANVPEVTIKAGPNVLDPIKID